MGNPNSKQDYKFEQQKKQQKKQYMQFRKNRQGKRERFQEREEN